MGAFPLADLNLPVKSRNVTLAINFVCAAIIVVLYSRNKFYKNF
jgi:hypothetical protein